MAAWHHLRLLLWKDYIIRKRNLVTLFGTIWAMIVLSCLYVVRINTNNQDFQTCQFPARALPSAGMLTFLQSFICSVNNECTPLDDFEDIPTYENAKLTQLQRQFVPVLYNETVLEVAANVPNAIKLLATMADIADNPTFVSITKNGIQVRDLFNNPGRVRRHIATQLNVDEEVALSVMESNINVQGIVEGHINRCNPKSLLKILKVTNETHMDILADKLCALSNGDIQKFLMDLLMEINFEKYVKMLGEMYFKLTSDTRLIELGDTLMALIRTTKFNNFVPRELLYIVKGIEPDFAYFNISSIQKFINIFEQTFGDTAAYKSLKDMVDTLVLAIEYLYKFTAKEDNMKDTGEIDSKLEDKRMENITKALDKVGKVIDEMLSNNMSIDIFQVLIKPTNLILQWLPKETKHDVLFYSTLVIKLIEGARKVIYINMHIEEMTYNVSLRHPEGVKLLTELSPEIIGKTFDALVDAKRTQILTSKMNPGQMFCDGVKLQAFLEISKDEADRLKTQLCNDVWKAYVNDLITSFGVFEVKDNINSMASLLIQETLGKDTTNQLYTVEHDMMALRDFVNALQGMANESKTDCDWHKLFNVSDESDFVKIVQKKAPLGKQMLIVTHGAIAKEIVLQNLILNYKISPFLRKTSIIVNAINRQLDLVPMDTTISVKKQYPNIVASVLSTALDEEKSYKTLSTHSEDIFCKGVDNAASYLQFPNDVDKEALVSTLCDVSQVIEDGLKADSHIGRAIRDIKSMPQDTKQLNWTGLIDGVKELYNNLDQNYTFLFEYTTYGMDENVKADVEDLSRRAKKYWFGIENLQRSLHLSIKLAFRFLDLLDREVFNITSEPWLRIKFTLNSAAGPLTVVDQLARVVAAASKNESYPTDLPPSTVQALQVIIPALPIMYLEEVDVIQMDNDVDAIISLLNGDPAWPCSTTSLGDLLGFSPESKASVRAMEKIFCMNRSFQKEWIDYLTLKDVTFYRTQSWNNSAYDPHVFLKFSGLFDAIIEDTALIKEGLETITNTDNGKITLLTAFNYAVATFKNDHQPDPFMRRFFRKMDTAITAINTSTAEDIPLHLLWEEYIKCSSNTSQYIDDDCKILGRGAWKFTFKLISVVLENLVTDLLRYFTEINDPNSNLLQLMGFTKNTGLYMLYDRLPEFIDVLLNSYLDYGFMSQVRRESFSQFWDCEAILDSLSPPMDSEINSDTINMIKPYVCPSFLYWISMPRDANTLLNLVAKPQYYMYTAPVQNLTSSYENLLVKGVELAILLKKVVNETKAPPEDDIQINTIQEQLEKTVDSILNYKLNNTNQFYRSFFARNEKQVATFIYVTRVVTIVNKLIEKSENLNVVDVISSDEDLKTFEKYLTTIVKTFKRRPHEAIMLFFDVVSDVLWKNDTNYNIVNALDTMCENLRSNTSIGRYERTLKPVCDKPYQKIFEVVSNDLSDDYNDSKASLLNLVQILQGDEKYEITNIIEFLNKRKELMKSIKSSVKHSYELGIPVYLQYLQSNLNHYNIILSFLSGEDWWTDLRDLYDGPHANTFFDATEISFNIAEDIMTNLDKIHLVRLLREINLNDTDSFCQPNITLSDYVPDSTGVLSRFKIDVCSTDKLGLFSELPPLVFASQNYDQKLKLRKEVNYTALNMDILRTEAKLNIVRNGPQIPKRPEWITDDKVSHLRHVALHLLSVDSMTKISFGVIMNFVDATTLFLNNSQCVLCSHLTTWFKQLNLQLIKKQEYDNLLCHMNEMNMNDIYRSLRDDFHWDMTLKELMASRNYTKFELNKSINEFLSQVKAHLLDDLATNTTKLAGCLASNVTRNAFGNATLFFKVLSKTAKLLRSQLPHLHEIDGFRDLPYIQQLATEMSHNMNVRRNIKKYIKDNSEFTKQMKKIGINEDVVNDIENSEVNLRVVRSIDAPSKSLSDWSRLNKYNWDDICDKHNCSVISEVIRNNVNRNLIDKELPEMQDEMFWRFDFVSNILEHVEDFLEHSARLLGVASAGDLRGVRAGGVAATTDFLLNILTDDTLEAVLYSLNGMTSELQPLLKGSVLEHDLNAVSKGLSIGHQFRNYLLKQDLKIPVWQMFRDPERIESSLSRLGINNTNFWSVAAPRIHAGYIDLKPILVNQADFSIHNYVCQVEKLSEVVIPANLDVVTLDDVYGAVIEQFCVLSNEQAQQIIPTLIENMNYTYVMDKVSNVLLSRVFEAANLSEAEGAAVVTSLPQMAALLPIVRRRLASLPDALREDPLLRTFKNVSSLADLVISDGFLSSAGNLMCGKPFQMDVNRFYTAITSSQDFANKTDLAQLDLLPTDFCRSLYTSITEMRGGKIVWSFVKPLVMGKILYTPQTPQAEVIMQKANTTFAHLIRLTNMIHSFAASFPSLDKLSQHREGITVLRQLITTPGFSEVMTVGDFKELNVDDILSDLDGLKDIGGLLSKASDILRCVNLNRIQAMEDEDRLQHEAARLTLLNEFSAAIVFLNSEYKNGDSPHVEYKIRMDIENLPTTTRLRNYLWIPGPESNFLQDMRYFRGFVQVQDLIDKSIIELHSPRRVRRDTDVQESWAIYTQQAPYPCYRKDIYQTSLYESQALIVVFFFSLLFTVSAAVRFNVIDTESGNTMLMSVMGVNLRYHSMSWFIASAVEMCVTCVCMTALISWGGILPRTDPSLLLSLLLIFGFSILSFCYMMSRLFSSASFAAICVAIAYLITFMPFVIILSLEAVLSVTLKILVGLSMSSALSYAFFLITRFEARGEGVGWRQLHSSPGGDDDVTIAIAAGMMVLDALLYLAIGCLLDRFYGMKTVRSNFTTCMTSGEKAGVSIVNVTKIYGEGTRRQKVALNNVSIELHKGQITTLLGHNGAGKTTLINILNGMLRPTKGHVIIRTDQKYGTNIGVCPQRNVLFDNMTAREHIAFYAQLKTGQPFDNVEEEVDKVVSALSLGAAAMVVSRQLSGGTRRRLCVALAFVGRAPLVSLDEPTAGVDPPARREIWSMIGKLRENRTILLTTHHMDEAELLSDQVIIMHKGQIHTTGSPIEIKRTLGNGYRLTATFPTGSDDVIVEEKTKLLLATVRDVIKDANLVDVNGLEVEITLPFFDANGLNNNFLQLCTNLESRQEELGFQSFSLDCSSLEQVFFNVIQQADHKGQGIEYVVDNDTPSKSGSSSSIRNDSAPLVSSLGPLKGTAFQQLRALLYARYLHYIRNRWLLFMLVVLPSLFVATAMGFSMIRPPADSEVALHLQPELYEGATQYLVSKPTIFNKHINPTFAQNVMDALKHGIETQNWTEQDTPYCVCEDMRQQCNASESGDVTPQMMVLPDAKTLNEWIVSTHENYIEKRYGGFSSAIKNNVTNFIAWYNNKGHHAMPSFLNSLNNALLRTVSGDQAARITTYTHPLKISKEQISKDTVYQHVADAGISGLLVVSYSLVTAGAAVYLVGARSSQQKRLQLLSGVPPPLYWGAALLADLAIIVVNIIITVLIFLAFGFPVFVERNNLPAICILILLYGYACSNLVYVVEKTFREASLANMMLFCLNSFVGLIGIAILLILDIISESEATDNARWVIHKILMLCPQYVLGDGLLEISKNTIQSQVLSRFAMDTYRDPLNSSLLLHHLLALLLVGTALMMLNLAIEYNYFQGIFDRFRPTPVIKPIPGEIEDLDVTAERKHVEAAIALAQEKPVRLPTIGNINAGLIEKDMKKTKHIDEVCREVAMCSQLSKLYPTLGGDRLAVGGLTLALHARQCTALLGENGAGKSTTFSMLTGEVRPTSGQIYLNGNKVESTQLCSGIISYCPQNDAVDPLMTVRETLQFYCRLRGIAEQDEVIKRTLEMFSLRGYAGVRSAALSGGNRRKLCAALALMARSTLVLLDEPTSGMDPVSRGCVTRGVRAARTAGRAALLSTHALRDARRLAARVALLRAGTLVALAPLDLCLSRFGGGYVVSVVTSGDSARAVWTRLRAVAPHARLRLLQRDTLHLSLPSHTTVDGKEVLTKWSDVFRLMAELQSSCDIEDFTINQSSLDQMFLSFSDKGDVDLDPGDLEPLQEVCTESQDRVTSL